MNFLVSRVKGFPETPFWGPQNPKFAGLAAGRQIRTPSLATVEPRECLLKNRQNSLYVKTRILKQMGKLNAFIIFSCTVII
jgi:hypothetical protein